MSRHSCPNCVSENGRRVIVSPEGISVGKLNDRKGLDVLGYILNSDFKCLVAGI